MLGKGVGVVFTPARRAERVTVVPEVVAFRDRFAKERLGEGTYLPGRLDAKWTPEVERDFMAWIDHYLDELPASKEQIEIVIQRRTW